jgi:hypothetical protein
MCQFLASQFWLTRGDIPGHPRAGPTKGRELRREATVTGRTNVVPVSESGINPRNKALTLLNWGAPVSELSLSEVRRQVSSNGA